MLPKKVKNLLPNLAIENKEDLQKLQKINDFYWNRVRETITTTSALDIRLLNLGSFVRKDWLILEELEKCLEVDKNMNVKVIAQKTINSFNKKVVELSKIKDMYNLKIKKRLEIKDKKNEYYKNLEKQGSNYRGDNQQHI